jgi:antagonist of KipI
MNLRIIKAGLLDTIQDLGRYKYQYLGINPGGAMDKLSAQIANVLVGNKTNEPVIELHFPASEIFFEQPALIAISGADFSANINAEEIPCLHPILVSKYSILQFHGLKAGARAYLAINGGLDIPQWLDSYSTNLKAIAGGYKGRAFQKEDEIRIRSMESFLPLLEKKEFYVLPWKADIGRSYMIDKKIMVLPGREWNRLSDESKKKIFQQSFAITNQSDRMGCSLKSEPLSMSDKEEVVSSAVNFGTIQLLPDGQLTVLMADHQTTGGYPRLAHVITAHLPKLVQMRPGEKINFSMTDIETAEELLIKQYQHLQQLQNACNLRLSEFLNK